MSLVPYKAWKLAESERLDIKLGALQMRIHRGRHPVPVLSRFNSRVVFVEVQSGQ